VVQEHGEDPAVVDDNAEASGGVLHDVWGNLEETTDLILDLEPR
jgi:hypothetical protein